jgi:hypothetical protein
MTKIPGDLTLTGAITGERTWDLFARFVLVAYILHIFAGTDLQPNRGLHRTITIIGITITATDMKATVVSVVSVPSQNVTPPVPRVVSGLALDNKFYVLFPLRMPIFLHADFVHFENVF